MKVVLLAEIKALGKKGDIKEVSDGYARNFLLPKKLAEIATVQAIKKSEEEKKKHEEAAKAELEKTEFLAESLQGKEIYIRAKEKDGKLFGSIAAKAIVKELQKENPQIQEKSVILPEPIKELGEYEVKIELDHGIETSIMVIVESEN